jgi:hypothetical protein
MGYEMDLDNWVMDIMPNIHTNKNIPKEIKDSYIELALVTNLQYLYESID